MKLDKKSTVSDAVGNLYRSALFLARSKGEEETAIDLIEKTARELSSHREFFPLSKKINKLLKKYPYPFKSQNSRLILAEKILDEYLLLK